MKPLDRWKLVEHVGRWYLLHNCPKQSVIGRRLPLLCEHCGGLPPREIAVAYRLLTMEGNENHS